MLDTNYTALRKTMVVEQLAARGIFDRRILEACSSIPRHVFVRGEDVKHAYSDHPLPIGFGQTISQPYIVALMTEMINIKPEDKVLEIGTGSGYQSAILGSLAAEVHTVEMIQELAKRASEKLSALHINNVHVHIGDGSCGWESNAPYDGIIVTAAAPALPKPLLSQLKDAGRLVIPIGDLAMQYLEIWKRVEDEFVHEKNLSVCFVPLRGKFGWK